VFKLNHEEIHLLAFRIRKVSCEHDFTGVSFQYWLFLDGNAALASNDRRGQWAAVFARLLGEMDASVETDALWSKRGRKVDWPHYIVHVHQIENVTGAYSCGAPGSPTKVVVLFSQGTASAEQLPSGVPSHGTRTAENITLYQSRGMSGWHRLIR
jgi:hypothetical protein